MQRIEEAATETGLHLLYAAATRTRLTILGESQGKLDAAIAMAEERLPQIVTNSERFLILETIGRQLAYAHRDQEALTWMNQAIQLNIAEFGIFRRNVLITAGEVVARTGHPESAPAYTSRAVEVARTSILEPVRLAEALGEHSLALWNAGSREDSFAAWEEGVEKLLDARDQKPSWTQTFLLFLQAAGFFSGMSLWGKITDPNFAIPKPGHFLAFDNMPVEKETWKQWHDEIAPLYASNPGALGVLASLASVLDSPVLQSLVSQIGLARSLEQVFKISPSIRARFVAPFFTRYWQRAISSSPEQFRTSAAYTQKAYTEVASLPPLVRVKKLLNTMVFCTNLSLPPDLRAWLDEDS